MREPSLQGWREQTERICARKTLAYVIPEFPTDLGKVVPHNVDTVHVDRCDGVDDIPDRLGHLPVVHRPVRVREELLRKGELERGKHRGEVYRVEPGGCSATPAPQSRGEHGPDNVLAYDLDVGRPACRQHLLAVGPGEANGGKVHRQCVDPDVYSVRVVIRDGNPPRQSRAGPRHREVLEWGRPQLVQYILVVLGWVDCVRVLRVVCLEDLLELGQAKLVVLFLLPFHRRPALYGDALLPACRIDNRRCLHLGVEAFVRYGVPASVTVLIDEAFCV